MKNFILVLFVFQFVLVHFSCESNTPQQQDTNVSEDQKASDLREEKETDVVPTKSDEQSFVYGIDISKFQGDEIDYLHKKKDSLAFIICKATEGITYTDPKFGSNWKTIPEKGFIRGAYHFYRSIDKPVPQANNFTNAISDLKASNLPPIVDFEGGGIDKSQSVEMIQKGLILFLETVEKQLKRRPIIYVDLSIGNTYLNNASFSKYPLWIASYSSEKAPPLPDAWTKETWTFWQKSSNYVIDSQKNDFDQFNGSLEDLQNFIKGD